MASTGTGYSDYQSIIARSIAMRMADAKAKWTALVKDFQLKGLTGHGRLLTLA